MSIEKMNFKRWVHKVLPAVYDESLSYYELLCKITAKLNEVIEQGNTTSEGLQELKSYVDNYFENLDVQTEINNKLDEMAESGQLTDIIAQYLQLAGVLAYDTKTAMKTATNLVDGSICKTLGNLTYNDGYGAFYKVRQIQNTDVVDDNNIVALHDPDLVAEKIINYFEKNEDIPTIMIGDSYGVGTTAGGLTIGWCDRLKALLNLSNENYIKLVEGGAGFVEKGNQNHNFLELLQLDETVDKSKIKRIIVVGGYNDNSIEHPIVNETNLTNNIISFINYCKNNYPNAKIYIGMAGNSSLTNRQGVLIRFTFGSQTYPLYKKIGEENGAIYINGIETILKNYDLLSSDTIHPTENGYIQLANAIKLFLEKGSCFLTTIYKDFLYTPNNYNYSYAHDNNIYSYTHDGKTILAVPETEIGFESPQTIGQEFTLGQINITNYKKSNDSMSKIPIKYYCSNSLGQFYGGDGFIEIDDENNVKLINRILKNDGNAYLQFENIVKINFFAGNTEIDTIFC